MPKRFVLSGYFGFKNFGDEEILASLVNKLQKGKNTISVISSDPIYTRKQFKHINCIYTFDFTKIFCLIKKSDILISGGGSLLQDVTSIKSLFYYLLVIFTAILLGKKVIIFAQGIGPINNPLGKLFTKNILKHCHYVSVRDKKSFELLNKWGIKADLLCDPIFSSNVPNLTKNNTAVIQLRNCRSMNEDFIDRLVKEVCDNFSDYNIEIIPFQHNIDFKICKNFEKSLKLLNPKMNITVFENLNNTEIINKISKAQYLIGMRFHAIIIGLLSKCKTLAINYDIKVEKIANEFNIPVVDLKNCFGNSFKELKTQDTDYIYSQVKKKTFNWSGFDKSII